jgi:micrococcal nuclease
MKWLLKKITFYLTIIVMTNSLTAKSEAISPHLIKTSNANKLQYKIERVKDGDGVFVSKKGEVIEIRLACIDAPEVKQTWGIKSTDQLNQLLPHGQNIELREIGKDRYKRTVAEIFVNSRSVNLQMVSTGDAVVYPRYLNNCESTKNQYLQAENYAKINKLGFWKQENPIMPWDFRRNHRKNQAKPKSPNNSNNSNNSDTVLPTCVNRDCDCNFNDFESYEQAQFVLAKFPHDPFNLDRDRDGEACESLRR